MTAKRETFVATRASRLVLGVTVVLSLGAAVAASPISLTRAIPAPVSSAPAAVTPVAFKPLGDGPAVAVSRSFGRHDEDCVTVTQVKGADGRVYATRGMVCAQ